MSESEMAEAPSDSVLDVFTSHFDGVFGRFEAGTSFEVFYLLTALRMPDLERLDIARDAFPFEDIDFEELIQRDIDYARVDEELVGKYLLATNEGARFFPPLLVSVVPVGDDGRIAERYETIETIEPPRADVDGKLVRTWDEQKFRLSLYTKKVATGHTIQVGSKTYNYMPHAARFSYNKDAVKLVVIDGQHRFEALRMAHARNKRTLGHTAIPVCILFSANAVANENPAEDIRRDFRELFVTINSKAKEVSGHFLVLLADQRLSAHAVRSLANGWKQAKPSLLPLLEWNTREASKAHQLQRPFSITTVSILADALEKYAFRSAATTEALLNLRSVTEALETADDAPRMRSIKEDVFALSQVPVLRAQIESELRPAIETLFSMPTPYAEQKAAYLKAYEWLEKRIAENTPSAEEYCEVLFGSRRIRSNDLPSLPSMQANFENHFLRDGEPHNALKPYFLNVFQQAFVRAWTLLCGRAGEPCAAKMAEVLVPALNTFCFSAKENFFLSSNPYMQQALYRGERVIVTEPAKLQWANLILSTLLYRDAYEGILTLATEKKKRERLRERVRGLCEQSLVTYLAFLWEKIEDYVKRSWRFMELDAGTLTELSELSESDDDDDSDKLTKRLTEIANKRHRRAKEVLLNRLGLEAKAVAKWSSAGTEVEEE